MICFLLFHTDVDGKCEMWADSFGEGEGGGLG